MLNSTTPSPQSNGSALAAVFLATLMVFSFALNLSVCIAIVRCVRLRTATSVFIFHLCVADILMTTCSMSVWLVAQIKGMHYFQNLEEFRTISTFWHMVDIFCGTLSILSLAVISVGKYVAITRPLTYKAEITKKTNSVAIVLVWIYASSAASLYLARQYQTRATIYSLVMVCFVLPFSVILISYGRIYIIARSHAQVMNTQAGRKKAKEIKAAKTIAVVIGTFCLCWLPFFLVNILYAHKVPIGRNWANAMKWLTYVNTFLNPLIYTMFDRGYRGIFYEKILTCFAQYTGDKVKEKRNSSDQISALKTVSTQATRGGRNGSDLEGPNFAEC